MGSRRDRDLTEFFERPRENDALFNAPELPNEEITVKILLEKPVVEALRNLNKPFRRDNMNACQDLDNNKAIVVTGIPKDYSYGAQAILTVVKKVDPRAIIL